MKIKKENFIRDLIAGFSVALVSIPEGIGFAMVVGVNPVYGLYTGIIATIVGALTTGSTLMVVTLTNTLAISAASVLSATGNEGNIAVLVALTVMVGVVQFLMGLLRMGGVLKFIAHNVMTGFVLGSALLIVLGQLSNLTGYNSEKVHFANEFAEFFDWMVHFKMFDTATVIVGLATIFVIWLLQRLEKLEHIAYAIALVIMTVLVGVAGETTVEVVGDFAVIPSGLPMFMMPDFSAWRALLVPAIAIALIGLIDAAGVNSVFGTKESKKKGPSQDFIGQGLANMVGGFFQGLPSGGSFSRTALNVSSGAMTRFAGVLAGIVTMIIVILFAPFVESVPHATLAGLLIVIGIGVIKRLKHDILTVWYTSSMSMFVMTVTFVSTMIMPLYYAIFVGVALSIVIYVFSTSMKVRITQLERLDHMKFGVKEVDKELKSNDVTILSLHGNIFFALANNFENIMPEHDNVTNAVVILRLRNHKMLSDTTINAIMECAQELKESGNFLMISGVDPLLMKQLDRTDVDEIIGMDSIFEATHILEESTEKAWEVAKKRINK